jgi:hypothetical protein
VTTGSYKISPKPCRIESSEQHPPPAGQDSLSSGSGSSGEEGICMFVWECLKSDGKHLGMCVDGFMFGSCCHHNSSNNFIDKSSVVTMTTTDSGSGGDDKVGVQPDDDNDSEEVANIPFITKTQVTSTSTSTTTTSTARPTTTTTTTTTTTPPPPPPTSTATMMYINPLGSTTTESPSLFQNISSVKDFHRGCGVAPLLPQKRIVGGAEGQ